MAGLIVFCSFIGFLIAFIPLGSFLLIPVEAFLLYKVMDNYHAFDLWVFLGAFAILGGMSFLLKVVATFLHAVPVIGQFANSLVACAWILIFGFLADKHYAEHAHPPLQTHLAAPAPWELKPSAIEFPLSALTSRSGEARNSALLIRRRFALLNS